MSKRKKYWLRCERCKMRRELCLCADMPSLTLATKLVLIAARRELQVPTNTGRLAAQALTNSVMLTRGDRDEPCDLAPHLPADGRILLLYPAEDSIELTPAMRDGGPYTLVVPDGNWRQTSKMRRREPLLTNVQTVTLPICLSCASRDQSPGPSDHRGHSAGARSTGRCRCARIARSGVCVDGGANNGKPWPDASKLVFFNYEPITLALPTSAIRPLDECELAMIQ